MQPKRGAICDCDLENDTKSATTKSPPGSVFSFLHRRGAFFLFDKAEKKEWGSQKRRALDKNKRTELNGATPVYGGTPVRSKRL